MYGWARFIWLRRDTYRLSKELNPEEGGRVREFDLIPESFLRLPAIEAVLRDVFATWRFPEESEHRAYEVQLSAIHYRPTLAEPVFPSPVRPHQDQIDGAIVVLRKTPHLRGGENRLYTLDDEPLVEFELDVGEALFVRDSALKHQVQPMTLDASNGWRPSDLVCRDVLLVRFQPVGR